MSPPGLLPLDSQTDTTPWWGAWSALIIVGCFYLSQAVGMMLSEYVVGVFIGNFESSMGFQKEMFEEQSSLWLLPLSLFFGTVFGALISLKVAQWRAQLPKNSMWLRPFIIQSYDPRALWSFIVLGSCLGLGFVALTNYVILPPEDLPQPLIDAVVAAPFVLKILWILIIVALFPFVEEFFFRGVLFTGVAQSWGAAVAGVLTTLVFVLVHMPKVLEYWPALIAVALIGSFTMLIRIQTGSLLPGMVLHGAYNSVLVASALFTQIRL